MGSIYQYTLKGGQKRWGFACDLGQVWSGEKQRNVRQQLRKEGFKRRLDAEAAMAEEDHGIRQGSAPSLADRKITVAEFAAQWMAGKKAAGTWRPTSQRGAEVMVRLYIVPCLGRVRLTELRAGDVRHLLARAAEGKLGAGRPLSPRTLNQLRTLTRNMLGQAVRDQILTWNPASATEAVKVEETEPEPWTTGQRDSFLALVARERPDLHAGLTVCAHTGIRRGELAALLWDDIDLDARRLKVERTAYELSDGQHTGPPKSKRSRRVVPFGQDVAQVLRAHRRQQASDRLAASEWEDHGLVVTDAHGDPVRLWALTVDFGKLARQAGLPGTLHILRHTSVCTMLRAGVPPHEVAAIHGHSVATMMATYAHVLPDQLSQWADLTERYQDSW